LRPNVCSWSNPDLDSGLVQRYCHADDSDYLLVWAADADKKDSDFVAVLDAKSKSPTYGTVLATVEVGLPAGAHHSEHQMPPGGKLFVNGFESGHSFVPPLVLVRI
jgi:hypothetical protein